MSAETSKELASVAARMLQHEDPVMRSLAASVLRQFEEDPRMLARVGRSATRSPEFWDGYWEGMWACREHFPKR